jgi:NAD(P)-dependent dehydrogenase (short-subunit alcohol dehydrogenase family)
MTWKAPDLRGRVAVVTGASRGVGRGIALALGDCGATVYVTGRSTRSPAAAAPDAAAPDAAAPPAVAPDAPGTVDDTAEAVTARGGHGIAAPTDHTDDDRVAALFARVADEQDGRLDLAVANAWGGYEGDVEAEFARPFWEGSPARWDAMFTSGLRAQYTTACAAAPALVATPGSALVVTGGTDLGGFYLGNVAYDVVKAASSRLVVALAHELRAHEVTVVGVYPGFTRTEAVVAAFAKHGAEPPPETHSPEFVGRAVAEILADPDRMALSGGGAQAATFAARYGFADVDGETVAPFVLPDEYRLASP